MLHGAIFNHNLSYCIDVDTFKADTHVHGTYRLNAKQSDSYCIDNDTFKVDTHEEGCIEKSAMKNMLNLHLM